jgi:hypothetical protein
MLCTLYKQYSIAYTLLNSAIPTYNSFTMSVYDDPDAEYHLPVTAADIDDFYGEEENASESGKH